MLKLDEYLETGVDKKLVLKSVKIYEEYFGSISSWREVKRENVHSLTGAEDFRSFLVKRVKNTKTRNRVIRVLEQVFDYLVMEGLASGEEVANPFIYDYDKEREFFKYGTTRERIPFWIMKEMVKEFKKDDFKFGRDNDSDCLSASLILWLMMIFPLRSVQARYLDSGLGDEFVYSGGEMIRNDKGVKGRREGFIRKGFYSGLSRENYECLYVNTNKNNEGFEVPFCSEEIVRIIERQVEWVRSQEFGSVDKEYGKKRSKRIWLLFPDKNGKVISKAKLDRLWKKFCGYMSEKLRIKLVENGKCIYGLHSLRVSGVSMGVESMDIEKLGQFLSGQSSEIVLHYNQVGDLKSLVKGKEQKLIGSGKEVLLLEGVKMKASKIYDELIKGTTAKGRRTLEDVKMVCDHLESKGLRISVSLIGREFERQGIKIVEQSLRNNKKVISYIGLRIKEQKVEAKDFFGDSGLEEQIRCLQHENMILRKMLKNINLCPKKE